MGKSSQLFRIGWFQDVLGILKSKRIMATIFAALAVIVMVGLLTVTINHAREQKIIQLFAAEQGKLCRSLSLATGSILQHTEGSIRALAGSLTSDDRTREAVIRNFFAANSNTLHSLALLEHSGKVIIYAAEHKTALEEGLLHRSNGEFTPVGNDVFFALRVPLRDGTQLVAVISLQSLFQHLLPQQGEGISSQILLADATGRVLLRTSGCSSQDFSPESVLGVIAARTPQTDHEPNRISELTYTENGRAKLAVATGRWLAEDTRHPFIIVATDLQAIIAAARTAFLNNMAGVAFLVVIVIAAAIAVIYNLYKNLSLQQRLKNLEMTRKWEGQLTSKQRIIEGVMEGLPIPAFVINRDHKIIFWNRACEVLTGYRRDEMLNTNRQYEPLYGSEHPRPVIADLLVDNNLEAIASFYGKKRVRPSGVVADAYEASDFYTNLNGKARHLFFLAAPIRDERGEVIAAIETLQDITRTVEVNRQLTEYAESLENETALNIATKREMEGVYNYLRSIMNSLPDALLDVNEDGTINNIIRHDRDDAWGTSHKGKHIQELVPAITREYLVAKWEAVKRGEINSFELELPSPCFPTKNYFITCSPVSGTSRYVVIRRDVTDVKLLEKKFYESQKLATVGHLAAGIAHEIRNPLSSIKMSLQIIKKRLDPQGNDLKRMDIALTEVAHLEALVNDILLYAKPAEPHKRLANVNNILEDALLLQESAIIGKNITVLKNFSPEVPLVLLDAGMLTQAMVNVYRNAVEAMTEHGVLTVTTAPTSTPFPGVKIEITDNGKGIDAVHMANIFDPFFTADKPSGTGLGLTQVKRLVELHGGEIHVSSTVGVGTTVRITLPV